MPFEIGLRIHSQSLQWYFRRIQEPKGTIIAESLCSYILPSLFPNIKESINMHHYAMPFFWYCRLYSHIPQINIINIYKISPMKLK